MSIIHRTGAQYGSKTVNKSADFPVSHYSHTHVTKIMSPNNGFQCHRSVQVQVFEISDLQREVPQ